MRSKTETLKKERERKSKFIYTEGIRENEERLCRHTKKRQAQERMSFLKKEVAC